MRQDRSRGERIRGRSAVALMPRPQPRAPACCLPTHAWLASLLMLPGCVHAAIRVTMSLRPVAGVLRLLQSGT